MKNFDLLALSLLRDSEQYTGSISERSRKLDDDISKWVENQNITYKKLKKEGEQLFNNPEWKSVNRFVQVHSWVYYEYIQTLAFEIVPVYFLEIEDFCKKFLINLDDDTDSIAFFQKNLAYELATIYYKTTRNKVLI